MWTLCRSLSNGQRGEVYEVEGDQVAVILDISEDNTKEGGAEKSNEHTESRLCWIHGTTFHSNANY